MNHSRRARYGCVCVVAVWMVASAQRAAADDWTTYQHDAHRTGRARSAIDPRQLERLYFASYASPLLLGESMLVNRWTPAGIELASLQVATGSVNWSTTVGGNYFAPGRLTYGDGVVVYGAENGMSQWDLFVHDASTGQLRYKLPQSGDVAGHLLHRNPTTNELMAYVNGGGALRAYRLGSNGGTLAWTAASHGCDTAPTLAGESIVLGGEQAHRSYDLLTGSAHTFYLPPSPATSIGGVTYDPVRRRLYVFTRPGLRAYRYDAHDRIEFLWESAPLAAGATGVALGPNGRLYCLAGLGDGAELDADTGHVLRYLNGLDNGQTVGIPFTTDHYAWIQNDLTVSVFDLVSGQFVRALLAGTYGEMVVSESYAVGWSRVDSTVYVYGIVPEPATVGVLLLGVVVARTRRRARRRDPAHPAHTAAQVDDGAICARGTHRSGIKSPN